LITALVMISYAKSLLTGRRRPIADIMKSGS